MRKIIRYNNKKNRCTIDDNQDLLLCENNYKNTPATGGMKIFCHYLKNGDRVFYYTSWSNWIGHKDVFKVIPESDIFFQLEKFFNWNEDNIKWDALKKLKIDILDEV